MEDIKVEIRIGKLKQNRQHKGQKEQGQKDKQQYTKHSTNPINNQDGQEG